MNETLTGYWIETASGRKFDLAEPDATQVCIEDIAHALSMICRYSGHCGEFYSVAQHCVHMAEHFRDPQAAKAALLHDAGEAYYGDIARPMKLLLGNFAQEYKAIRDKIDLLIERTFDVHHHAAQVKAADNFLMRWEARWLMPSRGEGWTFGPMPSVPTIEQWTALRPWRPDFARERFMLLFDTIELDLADGLNELGRWQLAQGIIPCF